MTDVEMSKVIEALKLTEIQSVEVITEDQHADARAALLADIRRIVREELRNYGTEMMQWIARSGA